MTTTPHSPSPALGAKNDSDFTPSKQYRAETHSVENMPSELSAYNMFQGDQALVDAVSFNGGDWAESELLRFGGLCGSEELILLGAQANENKPTLHTHSRHGARIDEVRFHPSYHQLMALSMQEGIHSSHWAAPRQGAHVARAAKSYLMAQVEAGHGCPITMTSAAIPTLKRQPDLYAQWADKVMNKGYDARNVSHELKDSVTIGMAMTEKQGGSDVQANSTRAFPIGPAGGGQLYELVGHKYFVSAPMSDAFLVLA